MHYHQEVDPLGSSHLEDEKVPSEQGGIDILGDQSEGEMHNI